MAAPNYGGRKPNLLIFGECVDKSLMSPVLTCIVVVAMVTSSSSISLFLCVVFQGSLDIVLTAKFTNASSPKLVFLNSDVAGDTCFLKVTGKHNDDAYF